MESRNNAGLGAAIQGTGQWTAQQAKAGAEASCGKAMGAAENRIRPQSIRAEVDVPADKQFGFALMALKDGLKVTRHGWNGKGMWLELQRPDSGSKMTLPYIYLNYPGDFNNRGQRVPWAPSQTDVLAEDWAVLPNGADPGNPF